MKFFLDSAKINEIDYAINNWHIEGITTNPRHIMNSGITRGEFIKEIKKLVSGTSITVSVEVNPHLETKNDILREAKILAAESENFVIKVPAFEQGLNAVYDLNQLGIKTNVTLVFNAVQAIQASKMGAYYISPFVGWREERGEMNINFVSDIVKIIKNYGFKTEVLIAAIRTAKQITEAAIAGADIVTAGFDVYKTAFENPFTDMGLKIFGDSWDKTKSD
ncbi:MAG: transaldolase family protein [Athalassotoga sp.]|uniref:transaldolase family protein n=1 Tax=Athalassotoga sp. TaxID=2022597 RepID=UPI003D00F3BE